MGCGASRAVADERYAVHPEPDWPDAKNGGAANAPAPAPAGTPAKKAAKKSAPKKKKTEPVKPSNIQGSGMITCKCGESYREGWAWAHTCKEASKTANKTPARSFDDMRKEFDKIENKDTDSPPADIASPPREDAQPEVVAGA